jgi:hypothetical protein
MCNGILPGGGPEVPVHSSLLLVFQRSFLDLLCRIGIPLRKLRMDDSGLSGCEPAVWLDVERQIPSMYVGHFVMPKLYIIAHNNVSHMVSSVQNTDQYPVPFISTM